MNISQAANAANLPAKTIRYYEDIGLISPARGENGYRSFSEKDLHKLNFLARARSLGFAIEDCRTLLALYEDESRSSAEVRGIAKRHLKAMDRKIEELRSMQATLSELVERCSGDDRPDCPILSDLGRR